MADLDVENAIELLKHNIDRKIIIGEEEAEVGIISEEELNSIARQCGGREVIDLVIARSYSESTGYDVPDGMDIGIRSSVIGLKGNIDTVLDLGCYDGERTTNVYSGIKPTLMLYGIEFVPEAAAKAREKWINVTNGSFVTTKHRSKMEFDLVSLLGATFACVPLQENRDHLLKNISEQLRIDRYFVVTCSHELPVEPDKYIIFLGKDGTVPRLSYTFSRDSFVKTIENTVVDNIMLSFTLFKEEHFKWRDYDRGLYFFKK